MAVTYEERKALLTDLVLRMRQQRTPERSVTPIYQIVDSPDDLTRDWYPYVEAAGSTVRIRVHPLLVGYQKHWDTPGQRADGFDVQSDRSFGDGPRRLNRVVKEKTKDISKSIHGSVVTYLTSVRAHNEQRTRRRQAERANHDLAKERVNAFAANMKAAGFDAGAFLDDPMPWVLVTFAKGVAVMLMPNGTRAGLGFSGKARPLEAPEDPAGAEKYLLLLKTFLLGVAELKNAAKPPHS
jgi:hypothetical protein